uniref:uncharacterized protein n=1 Tax=Myxine glutinosa TaxID=7769 RepID=UPI00359027FA
MMKDTNLGHVCAFCKKDHQTAEEECGEMCHSSNGSIHVHYLCLLYSSGLCTDSQTSQETISNFPVEEIQKEILRGKKLRCNGCKRVGATVGCQIRTCPRTYHYPCAIEKKVLLTADADEGIYQIICAETHDLKSQRHKTVAKRKRNRPQNMRRSRSKNVRRSIPTNSGHIILNDAKEVEVGGHLGTSDNNTDSDETHCSFAEESLPMDINIPSEATGMTTHIQKPNEPICQMHMLQCGSFHANARKDGAPHTDSTEASIQARDFWANLVEADLFNKVFQPICELIRYGEASDQVLIQAFNMVFSAGVLHTIHQNVEAEITSQKKAINADKECLSRMKKFVEHLSPYLSQQPSLTFSTNHENGRQGQPFNDWTSADAQSGMMRHLDIENQEATMLLPGHWLDDTHIQKAHKLIRRANPHIKGLNPPSLFVCGQMETVVGNFIQILHTNGNHWVTVTNIGCNKGEVNIYDSLHRHVGKDVRDCITRMLHTASKDLTIVMPQMGKQGNSGDCGVMAIAAAFELAGQRRKFNFDTKECRRHVILCFEENTLNPFPLSNNCQMLIETIDPPLSQSCDCARGMEKRAGRPRPQSHVAGHDKGFKMYRFPSDPNRRKIWENKVSRVGWKPASSSKLCEAVMTNSHDKAHQASKLTQLKEYKEGSLMKVSDSVFDMVYRVELVFRKVENDLMDKNNVKKMLMEKTQELSSDISLPVCHNLKEKLINKFINARLHFYCKKKTSELKKETERKKKVGELGSKSMAMRKLAKKVISFQHCVCGTGAMMKDPNLGPVCAFCKKDHQTTEEECGEMCHSSNGSIHVHYLCLLYSSGLCTDSQTSQETISNFPVEEIQKEILRGKKLRCNGCKRVGATVGCQIRTCPRTYHYPCAIEKKVLLTADEDEGIYQICCASHDLKLQRRKPLTKRKRPRSKIETSPTNCEESDGINCSSNEEPLPMNVSLPLDSFMPDPPAHARDFWDNLIKADLVNTVFQPLCDLIRHGEASNQVLIQAFNMVFSAGVLHTIHQNVEAEITSQKKAINADKECLSRMKKFVEHLSPYLSQQPSLTFSTNHENGRQGQPFNDWTSADAQSGMMRHLDIENQEATMLLPGHWLDDTHIQKAHKLIRRANPHIKGLNPPSLFVCGQMETVVGNFIQILHTNGNHWVTVTNIGCNKGEVNIYDSLHRHVGKDVRDCITRMLHTLSKDLTIVMPQMGKQGNSGDCGVMAIAAAFELAGQRRKFNFDTKTCRSHVFLCFEENTLNPFPLSNNCQMLIETIDPPLSQS